MSEVKNAGFIKTRSNREAKLKREEEELQELINSQNKPQPDETEEDDNEADSDAEVRAVETADNAEENNQEISEEEKTFKKRYGDLRSHAAKQKKELEARIAELENKSGEAQLELPESDSDLDAWKKKYPDVSRIVEKMAEQIADKKFKDAKISLERIEKTQQETKQEQARAVIKKAHTDFDELQVSDKFHDWVEEQPMWIQNALYENSDDPQAVIRVLDLYRQDNPKRKTKKQAVEEASEVDTRSKSNVETSAGKYKYSESMVQQKGDKWYAEHSDAIDEAIRNGTFKYDISGSAR